MVTPKPDYVHIIWDSYAEHDAIKRAGKAFRLTAAALGLARTLGRTAEPKATLFKVDVAEFPVRDDYGAPRWDKVVFVGRYVVSWKSGHWVVTKCADGAFMEASFNQLEGILFDAAGNRLVVADSGNQSLRMVDLGRQNTTVTLHLAELGTAGEPSNCLHPRAWLGSRPGACFTALIKGSGRGGD